MPEADRESTLGDREIRAALLAFLRQSHATQEDVAVLEELGLCRGEVFVDVTLVNGSLHGFEIKSDRDSLRRLARQALFYSAVLDRATLVVGERHVRDAVELVPAWWELLLATLTSEGVMLTQLRAGKANAARDSRALVELLWLDDALSLLEGRGALRGFRSKPRRAVWDRVCELYEVEEIAAAVRERLKARSMHRSAEGLT
jgi:hypothetical protein